MEQALRIVLVSTERRWQGGEQQAYHLADGLRRRGHHVAIAALEASRLFQRMQQEGFPCFALRSRHPVPLVVFRLRRWLSGQKPAIVHLNDARSVLLGGLAAWRLPHTTTVAARRTAFPIRSPRRYLALCRHIVCVSRYAAQRCVESGMPEARVHMVLSGVDPQRAGTGDRRRARRQLQVPEETPLVLAVGSLVESKGHAVLLEAMPRVREKHPDVRLVIAGEGPERRRLEEIIARRQLDRHVRLLGFRTDVADLLNGCDLFVFPSLAEGLGTSLMDAMFARCPIVAARAGGIAEVVDPPDEPARPFAWMVQPGNAGQLADAIIELLDDRRRAAHMAERGYQYAMAHFTADRMVEQTLALYRQIVH